MELFVFDLDFTLWNAGDTFCSETSPPYTWNNDRLTDQRGRWIRLYDDTPVVLEYLKNQQKKMALASRTHAPEWANELLDIFQLSDYFLYKETYPGSKIAHFNKLQQHTSIPYHKMAFFDDELRNIEEVSTLGVRCFHVVDGIKAWQVIDHIYPPDGMMSGQFPHQPGNSPLSQERQE